MNLENYRESMTEDVVHSWAKDAQARIVEQARRIEELEGTIRRNLPHLNYVLDSLINDGIHPGILPGIYSRLLNTLNTQDTQDT